VLAQRTAMALAGAAGPAPPASLRPHEALVLLLQVLLLLGVAVSLGRLSVRLGMPAVVGELLAGVVLGPSVFGAAFPTVFHWLVPASTDQGHLLAAINAIGVILLVGITGAQFDVSVLRRRRKALLSVSLVSVAVPLGLGVLMGYLLPQAMVGGGASRGIFALFVGVALCVSAIPVIAKILTDLNLMHRDVGQLTLGAGVVADCVGWFLLSLVALLATGATTGTHIAIPVAGMAGFVLVAVLLGRPLVRALMRAAARSSSPIPVIGSAVTVMLAGAVMTQSLGLEPVFGAFVSGTLVSPRDQESATRLAPLRAVVLGVLAPVFLASAGLQVNLASLSSAMVLLWAGVLIAVAVAGKFAGAYLGARLCGLTRWEGCALGAGLNSRGLVEIVVATVGLHLGVLTPATYTIVVLIALVTSLMAPPVLRMAMAHVELSAHERRRQEDGLLSPPVPQL
jgi:Kef-type K+ transport system membrane component KefB